MSSRTFFLLVAVALFMAATFYLVKASQNLIWLNLILALFFAISAYRTRRRERQEQHGFDPT